MLEKASGKIKEEIEDAMNEDDNYMTIKPTSF